MVSLGDSPASVVDTNQPITAKLNGQTITPTLVTKIGTNTVITYHGYPTVFAPGSTNQVVVTAFDTTGRPLNSSWSLVVERYATLDVSQASAGGTQDTNKPGFFLKVAQLDPDLTFPGEGWSIADQVDYANAMIAGLFSPWYGTNTADTSTAATGNSWNWTNAIDFALSGDPGDFPLNYAFPGIPGVTGRDDNFAAEFQSFLMFPAAGYYRMGVNSDDGFRVSEGLGLTRQVLHVSGPGVDRDVAAVVSTTADGNGGLGVPLPALPIAAPVVYVDDSSCPNLRRVNLTNKIAVINNNVCNGSISDPILIYNLQTNGAVAAILLNDPTFALPYVINGTSPGPITIPVLCVNGSGGEGDLWVTNTSLTASIGASQQVQLGCADHAKTMGWVDFGFVAPQAGVYPIRLIYEQGSGSAGLEWARVLDDGSRVLLNDRSTTNSLLAFRARTVQARPTLAVSRQDASAVITYTGTLQSCPTVTGTYTDVSGATSPYVVPTGAAKQMFYRARN